MDPKRREKIQGIRRLQTEVDRLFLDLAGNDRLFGVTARAFRPNVDVFFSKADNVMIVKLELAGIDPGSVALEAESHTLHIHGRRVEEQQRDRVYQQMEIAYGPFERHLSLPPDIDLSRAEASYRNGFLEIVLPLSDRSRATRIPINIRDTAPDSVDKSEIED